MKKFKVVKGGAVKWDLEAEELKIEGGAAIFINAKEDDLSWDTLVIPLHTLDYIANYSAES